jgi:hypothetical protein
VVGQVRNIVRRVKGITNSPGWQAYMESWLLPRVRPRTWRDLWIRHGLVGYLVTLYVKRRYGLDEYRYRLLQLRDAVVALERWGCMWIVLICLLIGIIIIMMWTSASSSSRPPPPSSPLLPPGIVTLPLLRLLVICRRQGRQ